MNKQLAEDMTALYETKIDPPVKVVLKQMTHTHCTEPNCPQVDISYGHTFVSSLEEAVQLDAKIVPIAVALGKPHSSYLSLGEGAAVSVMGQVALELLKRTLSYRGVVEKLVDA